MILTDKDIENLDNYWHNQLSETDRQTMENRLKTDAAFRQAANEMRLITEGLEVVRLRKMKARLVDLEVTLPKIDVPSSTNWLKIVLIALAIALSAFAVWYFGIRETPTTKVPAEIVAYFEPYMAVGITMGASKNDRKKEARIVYAEKKYTQAIPLLEASFNETQDSMQLFYKGIAHLAIGEATAAQTVFEQLTKTQTVPQEATNWYLTLSYVATKQYDKARILLQTNTSNGYKEKAEKLLKEISEKK